MVSEIIAACVVHGLGNVTGQPRPPVGLGEQPDAAMTGDVATTEIGCNFTAFDG